LVPGFRHSERFSGSLEHDVHDALDADVGTGDPHHQEGDGAAGTGADMILKNRFRSKLLQVCKYCF
jgi:hypothetical protein